MRVGQAKELFRALTQQYFGGANVVFANQSRTAKQKEPLVVLTPGNVHRPQAPNYTFVDGEVVGHYLSRFSITVDLFTNGSPVVDEVSGKVVAYEDNAVDDMLSFADFLNSEHTVQWSHQNDVSILIDGDVLNLTGVAEAVAYRIVDFSAGVVFGVRGSIERVTPRVFLLSPAQVNIKVEEPEDKGPAHDLFAD